VIAIGTALVFTPPDRSLLEVDVLEDDPPLPDFESLWEIVVVLEKAPVRSRDPDALALIARPIV